MPGSKSVFALTAVFAVAVGSTGRAADLGVPMPAKAPAMAVAAYDWSGFYLGAYAGYVFGRSRVFEDGVLTEAGAPTKGATGGLLGGLNWQNGSLVLGLEADFGLANAVGHGTVSPPPTPTPPPLPGVPPPLQAGLEPEPNTYRLRWDSHVFGRLGYASGHWLFFATGGVAMASFSFQEGVVPGAPEAPRLAATFVGYSIGGGAEYAFTRSLIARVQYIYDDFGSRNFVTSSGDAYRVDLTGHTVRAGLAWKF